MRRLKILIAIFYVTVALLLFVIWLAVDSRGELLAARLEKVPGLVAGRDWYERVDSGLLQRLVSRLLRTPEPARDQVVVVSFDWRAFKIYGFLPPPRDVFAELIEKLRELKVRTILMDPLFADPELAQLSPAAYRSLFPALPLEEIRIVNPANYVGELTRKLGAAERRLTGEIGPQHPGAETRLTAFRLQRDQLLALIRRVADGEGSLGFERVIAARRDIVFPTDYSNIPRFQRSAASSIALLQSHAALPAFAGQEQIKSFQHLLTLYPRLLRSRPLLGINEVDRSPGQDANLKIRSLLIHLRLLARHRQHTYPGSVARAVAHYLGQELKVSSRGGGELQLQIGDRLARVQADGRFPLGYYNDPSFPTVIPAIEVLRERVPRARLQGKLAIVDFRSEALAPHFTLKTPVLGPLWPSDLKATLASNLLLGHRGPTLDRPAWIIWLEGCCIWVVMGSFLLLTLRLRTSLARTLLYGLLLFAAAVVLDLLLFMPHRWFGLSVLLLEIPALLIAAIAAHYLIQRAERDKVRRAFGFYLPAPVLEHMLKDESALRLGGERRALSIIFSDIRGFTSLSERADPEALGHALNVHLTGLTEAVFEQGGTLDKYMGDCVMAFFGAPLHHPDHAARAVAAALGMQERLRAMQPVWRASCGSEISIGVGVASGDVIVGNMGSEKLFDYTVIGDNVNLASRLEGLTKVYGVEILVAEETRRQAGDRFSFLEVDRVRVKGKQEPVRIYEVIGAGPPAAERRGYDEQVTAGLRAFRAGDLKAASAHFQEAAVRRAGARLPALYLERIQAIEGKPLPAGWDGVTDFDHK